MDFVYNMKNIMLTWQSGIIDMIFSSEYFLFFSTLSQ